MEPHAKFDAFIHPVTVILKNDTKQPDYIHCNVDTGKFPYMFILIIKDLK